MNITDIIIVENYSKEYETEISRLLRELQKEDEIEDDFDTELKDIEYYKRVFFKEEQYKTLIAKYGQNVAGYIIGSAINPRIFNVDMIYTSKSLRGLRIAKLLENSLAEYASKEGYEYITSYCTRGNVSSIKAHDNLEWEKTIEVEEGITYYKYTKKLKKVKEESVLIYSEDTSIGHPDA